MSLWGDLAKNGVQGLADGIGGMAKDLREAITGKSVLTSEDRIKLETLVHEMQVAALEADKAAMQGQIDLNKIDAQSTSLFKGGWRPATGWICVSGLGYQFLLNPLLPWIVALFGRTVAPLPDLDMVTLITLLGGLLGLGGFRTFEKIKGIK